MRGGTIIGGLEQQLYELERSGAWKNKLPELFRATEEELAQAKRRVEEADQILGEARAELTQIIIARGYLFPELHDDSRGSF